MRLAGAFAGGILLVSAILIASIGNWPVASLEFGLAWFVSLLTITARVGDEG